MCWSSTEIFVCKPHLYSTAISGLSCVELAVYVAHTGIATEYTKVLKVVNRVLHSLH